MLGGRYVTEIQQMMYAFGDVRSPLPESAALIEHLVHRQLVDVLVSAARVAHGGPGVPGGRVLQFEDLLFVLRHDAVKVARLRAFLAWRELRRSGTRAADDGVAPGAAEDDALAGVDASSLAEPADASMRARGVRRRAGTDLASALVAEATGGDPEYALNDEEAPDEETVAALRGRLADADRVTRAMSREEYAAYAECRAASFTYKKAKKFRDWLNPAMHVDMRLGDEQVELLGFLAWEVVRTLVEAALVARAARLRVDADAAVRSPVAGVALPAGQETCDLFAQPSGRTAVLPEDIRVAVRVVDAYRGRMPFARMLPVPGHPSCRRVRLF